MKKLMIIFIGAGMTLVSCKTHIDGLASNASDDVYYNPAKERKANVPPPAQQYESQQSQQYNPNQGKIAATEADKNNPYYKDPNFNYDDYYDNAYAARVKRFQQPLYGTSYYDSYYTNSYFYNYNPSSYGTSIYSSYNMGSPYGSGYGGYYSPATTYNNPYYNPYYNGYGSSMSYGMGYGNGMGYNPYGTGYGYNPYGMNGYGMGNGYYNSPMYSTGYFNSYDYNSGTYHYGPRGTHTGGNSTTTSPMPQPHRFGVANTGVEGPPSSAPFNQERFNQVSIPKENYVKIVEAKNPVTNNPQYQSIGSGNIIQAGEGRPTNVNEGRPVYNNGGTKGGMFNSNNNSYNDTEGNTQGNYSAPRTIKNQNTVEPQADPKPHKWFSGNSLGGDNGSNDNNTPSYSRPSGSGSFGGGSSGGGGNSGGSSGGGGVSRPRK